MASLVVATMNLRRKSQPSLMTQEHYRPSIVAAGRVPESIRISDWGQQMRLEVAGELPRGDSHRTGNAVTQTNSRDVHANTAPYHFEHLPLQ
jgi:hypothetical protein